MTGNRYHCARAALSGLMLLVGGSVAIAAPARLQRASDLWHVFDASLAHAKYIDLTHAFGPETPLGPDFQPLRFMTAHGAATAGQDGVAFDYATVGAAITAYALTTDQVGTQFDPPAHGNPHGATISDIPATITLRPLVVIDMSAKTRANPGAVATVADIKLGSPIWTHSRRLGRHVQDGLVEALAGRQGL